MKLAVLSDIHGNIFALNSVLNEINLANDYDKVLFLGDYAMAGPKPQETTSFCRTLAEQEKYEFIQGNTDKMIANYSDEILKTVSSNFPVMGNALACDVETLSDEEKTFLKNLPEQKLLNINGLKVLMVHGSPRRNNEDILPTTPLAEVEEMLKGVDADLILCGHTHLPCGFQTETNQTVVNVGSVGRPFTPNPQACYLTLEIAKDKTFVVKHNFVDYDIDSAVKSLKERGFKGVEKLAQILINPDKRHV